MEEIGAEDLAASELQQQQAQESAYLAASRVHDEAESGSILSESSEISSNINERQKRLSIASFDSSRTVKDRRRAVVANDSASIYSQDLAEEYDDRVEELSSQVRNTDRRYLTPQSSSLSKTTPSSVSSSSLSPDGDQPSKKSFFGLGSIRKNRRSSVDSISPSSPSSSGPFPLVNSSRASITSSIASSGPRRNSILPPFSSSSRFRSSSATPSIESDLGDATYVSYSSGRSSRKSPSEAGSSIRSGMSDAQLLARSARSTGGRKPSLRRVSRYASPSAIPEEVSAKGKSVYSVRFSNATRGLGLKSVAEAEALRAGGEQHAMRWTGVGRGRYGNMLLQIDPANDSIYAEQAETIKKKWRGFGSQRVDWAGVRVD